MRSNVPQDHLELISNGKVVASIALAGDRTRADTTLTVTASSSAWFVLRTWSDKPRLPVLDLYPFASTSPFYVTVDNRPVRSKEDSDYFVTWIDRVREEVEKHTGWNTADEKAAVMQRIEKARQVFVSGGQVAGRTAGR
jgi:hypothetical protein